MSLLYQWKWWHVESCCIVYASCVKLYCSTPFYWALACLATQKVYNEKCIVLCCLCVVPFVSHVKLCSVVSCLRWVVHGRPVCRTDPLPSLLRLTQVFQKKSVEVFDMYSILQIFVLICIQVVFDELRSRILNSKDSQINWNRCQT